MTLTVTARTPARDCAPRPPVKVTQTVSGGKLAAHVQATALNTQQPNPLRSVRFGTLQNARVTVGGQQIAGGQTLTVAAGSSTVDLTVERVTPGQATTVPSPSWTAAASGRRSWAEAQAPASEERFAG